MCKSSSLRYIGVEIITTDFIVKLNTASACNFLYSENCTIFVKCILEISE